MVKLTQEDIDRLADIAWWIKGFIASGKICDFEQKHVDSIERFLINEQERIRKEKG